MKFANENNKTNVRRGVVVGPATTQKSHETYHEKCFCVINYTTRSTVQLE